MRLSNDTISPFAMHIPASYGKGKQNTRQGCNQYLRNHTNNGAAKFGRTIRAREVLQGRVALDTATAHYLLLADRTSDRCFVSCRSISSKRHHDLRIVTERKRITSAHTLIPRYIRPWRILFIGVGDRPNSYFTRDSWKHITLRGTVGSVEN